MSEVSSAIELVVDYSEELKGLVPPDHELLQLLQEFYSSSEGHFDRLTEKFWDKPTPAASSPGSMVCAYVWGRFAAALKAAVDAAKIKQAADGLDAVSRQLYVAKLAKGVTDAVCEKCGSVILAHQFLVCDPKNCPLAARQDEQAKTLLEILDEPLPF
ncbi:MAG: hypothetical protein JNN11_03285 [Candidatus Doudnabacteria bacterium]|nr:hypothetical protein [Candidatus Doudnabacteria bacterium]